MTIYVTLSNAHVPVARGVFTALLGESVVSGRKPYTQALNSSTITFDKLVELSRKAEIPYALFFAPQAVADRQIKKKIDTLLAGVSKDSFSMNSRSQVRLGDIELIIEDLLRKQETLEKADATLGKNAVVGCLKNSHDSIPRDAANLRVALGFTVAEVKAAKTKGSCPTTAHRPIRGEAATSYHKVNSTTCRKGCPAASSSVDFAFATRRFPSYS